jgi:signal transduction histidine kinase
MLIFSNRFAGPMVNFRRQLKQFAKNGNSNRIKFRTGDFYQDINDNYNEICERIEAERRESSGTSKDINSFPPLEATNSIGSENHV